MGCACPEGLGLTTAVNTLASVLAECLSEKELELTAVLLTQLGDTLATLAVARQRCKSKNPEPE